MPELSIMSPSIEDNIWRRKKTAWLYSVDKDMFLISSNSSRIWNSKALSRRAVRIGSGTNKLIIDLPDDFYKFYFKDGNEFDVDATKESKTSEILIITKSIYDEDAYEAVAD